MTWSPIFRWRQSLDWSLGFIRSITWTRRARGAVQSRGAFNAVHMHSGVKVDFFIAGSDPFERERLRTRIAVLVTVDPPRSLWFDTAEHTLLRKLEWYRRGGEVSERQWRDVLAIVAPRRDARSPGLDRWATTLGVSDLLKRSMDNR
ncbi:MAG: hypothetical protein IPK33_13865 [Gemmatimonadetes bacterium]|nr:hypothetical protein [Gemmatimonadota bacterium]